MKKHSFLPLLLVVPLLSGCGAVGEPSFANNGNEVEFAQFSEDFANAVEANEFFKEGHIGSKLIKGSGTSYSNQETSVDGSQKDQSFARTTMKIEIKGDSVNNIARRNNKITIAYYSKSPTGNTEYINTDKNKYQLQEGTHDGKRCAFLVDMKEKDYELTTEFSDEQTMADAYDYAIKDYASSQVSVFNNLIATYASATEEEQKNYKFYESGNIFTIELKKVVENEERKNSDDEVYLIVNSTNEEKWQIDLTNGAFEYKHFRSYQMNEEYRLAFGSIGVPGQASRGTSRVSERLSIKDKNIKLKKIALDKYVPIGF